MTVEDQEKQFQVLAEVKILNGLNHPNIVALYNHEISAEGLSLILEYANDGDLAKKITEAKQMNKKLPEKTVSYLSSRFEDGWPSCY